MTEHQLTVEQCDRDAAAELAEWLTQAQLNWGGAEIWFMPDFPNGCREGVWDNHAFVQAFARHRQSNPIASSDRLPGLMEATQLAYGLLWQMHIDTRDANLALASEARKALLSVMSKDDQREGIERAKTQGHEDRTLATDQIKHMVDRFLCWKLPEDFSPDDGISFDPISNRGMRYERRREPTGTNLFTAIQAEAMVRHMIEGMPALAPSRTDDRLREALESVIREASLLHQNSVGCAQNHYGGDFDQFGMPGWLTDSAARIEAARQALSTPPNSRTGDQGEVEVDREAEWAVEVVNLKADIHERDEVLASARRVLSAIAEHRRGDYDDRNAAFVAIKLIDATLSPQAQPGDNSDV